MTDQLDLMPEIPPEEEEAWYPSAKMSPREWAKENLFSNWWNTVLSVVFGALFINRSGES